MFRLILCLLASLSTAPIVSSELFEVHIYDIDYTIYRLSMAAVYLFLSLIAARFAIKELQSNNVFYCMLICLLSLCMLTTGILNAIMSNPEMYHLLKPWKSGSDGFTWKNIYLSIEVLVGFVVAKNGLDCLIVMGICNHNRRNGIIRSNFDNYSS